MEIENAIPTVFPGGFDGSKHPSENPVKSVEMTKCITPENAPFLRCKIGLKLGTAFLPVLLLSACATRPVPPPQSMNEVDLSLNKAAQDVASVSRSLGMQSNPTGSFPLPTDHRATSCKVAKDSPLGRKVSIQWSGPVSHLLKDLSTRLGWSYEAQKMTPEPDVRINMKDARILDVIARATDELPPEDTVQVIPGIISLRKSSD